MDKNPISHPMWTLLLLVLVFLAVVPSESQSSIDISADENWLSKAEVAVSDYSVKIFKCDNVTRTNDNSLKAASIVAAELYFTHPLERAIEWFSFQFAKSLLIWVDWSIGPAQIKLSTLKKKSLTSRKVMDVCGSVELVLALSEHGNFANFKEFAIYYNSGSKSSVGSRYYAKFVERVYLNLKYQ